MKINPAQTIKELISVISYSTDIENNVRIYHSWRVAVLAVKISQKIGQASYKNIFFASLLHDIGGVGFPFHIIHYLSRDDKKSQNILLSHPIVGAQLASNIPGLSASAKLILDHHEWIDGHGYPRAKLKDTIPIGSQIIRVADALDILLQTKRFNKLGRLKEQMSLRVNKEYTEELFLSAFEVLREGDFFTKVSQRHNITFLFQAINRRIPALRIPHRIDAIGQTLAVVAEISDMKHPYTFGHSQRVSRYAMTIALAMKLRHEEITRIKWAGLLHDIGKISVSRKILDKPDKLNAAEIKKIHLHAHFSGEIIEMIPSLREIMPLAACHHEYFDGSGYPYGLKTKEIPLGARIITICDAFDAMTSNRPYRNALPVKLALRKLREFSGKQFDPEIVKIALSIFNNLAF